MSASPLPHAQANALAAFASGLLNPAYPPPAELTSETITTVAKRYAVYRNNVTVSLIDALGAIYPAVQRITGSDFFRAMARFHIRETPPASPLLFEYGREFPAFIESYEYARELPWLADVARMERAWLDAYHATDATRLSIESFADFDATSLSELRFVAHPATQVIRSRFPVAALFAAYRDEGQTTASQASDAQDALITRPDAEVSVSHLPTGGADFLLRLIGGATLGDAADFAMSASDSFDVTANINGMIAAGVFSAMHLRD